MKIAKTLIAGGVLLAAAAGGLYFFQEKKAAPVAEMVEISFEKKLENILNDFLKDIHKGASDYKAARRVVMDMVKPANLPDEISIGENAVLMEKTIRDLHVRMNAVMDIFKATDAKIEALAVEYPERRGVMTASWQKMRDEQANLYLAFFTSEEDVLRGYRDLMQFYQDKKAVQFEDTADRIQEKTLRGKIKAMEEQQRALLKGD